MPAPTEYPDWATDETNNVEPPDAKKALGWVPAEEPPSSWFNWWQWIVGLWVRWFDEKVNEHEAEITAMEPVVADAARKSQQNTFAKTQIIDSENHVADDPLISTADKPGDDPTDLSGLPGPPDPGSNKWKLVLQVPTQGGAKAGIFVGQFPYGAALVNNARWHVPTQRWRQLDDGYPSTAIVGLLGQYYTSYVPELTPPWEEWPNDGGGDFISGGNLLAGGGGASGNVMAKRAFEYAPAQTHWVMLWPEGGYDTFNDRMRLSAGESAIYRVRAPFFADIGIVNVKVEEYTNCIYDIDLYQTHTKPFSDTTTPGTTTTSHDNVHVNPGGTAVVVNHVLTYSDLSVDNEFNTYWVRVVCDPLSPADVDVYSVQIGFVDPGPRNH